MYLHATYDADFLYATLFARRALPIGMMQFNHQSKDYFDTISQPKLLIFGMQHNFYST